MKHLFSLAGPPGRPRALVVPALERMTWTPAEPLCGCARNTFSSCALTSSKKTTRVGREAPREIRGPTREKEGRYIAIRCFHVFTSSRRRTRFFFCSYGGLTSRPFVAPRGLAMEISPASFVLTFLALQNFGETLSKKDIKKNREAGTV